MALFKPGKPSIEEGDMVILYERFDSMKALTVTANGSYQNRFGLFMMKVSMPCIFKCAIEGLWMHAGQRSAAFGIKIMVHCSPKMAEEFNQLNPLLFSSRTGMDWSSL